MRNEIHERVPKQVVPVSLKSRTDAHINLEVMDLK